MLRPRTAIYRGWVVIPTCALYCACFGIALGQTSDSDKSVPTADVTTDSTAASRVPVVREVGPRAFLLKDKNGELVPVFNIPLEDFVNLLDQQDGIVRRNEPPPYLIEQITIQGVAQEDRVLLDLDVKLVLHVDDWVRIPLGLNDGHLRQRIDVGDDATAYVMVDPATEGHICFLRGQIGHETNLRLRLAYHTEQIGSETRLSFNLVRSSMTRMTLEIPDRIVVGTVADDITLEPRELTPNGGTRLHVTDVQGQLQIAWREEEVRSQTESSLLEVKGAILVNVVGQGNIESTARLQLRSFGNPVSKVRVVLPQGAQFLPSQQTGYTVEVVQDRLEPSQQDDVQMVEVKFDRPTSSPPEIQLKTNRVLETESQERLIDVAGFRVEGAFRQSGYMALAAGSESYPRWNEERSTDVSRINALPESLQQESVIASFEYFRQPCSLLVEIRPRKSKETIEPFHVLLVEQERLRLETRLDVTVRGAKAAFLDVDMQGWTVEDVEDIQPEELVDKTALVLEETSPLRVRLKQPSTGNLQLIIRAVRDLPTGTEQPFEVTLPRAHSQSLRVARLAVVPDDNIALTPNTQDLKGLTADTSSSFSGPLPERQQEPFFYRETTTLTPSIFVGEFAVRKGSIATTIDSTVSVQSDLVQVEQRFEYDIRLEPIEHLPLFLPAALPEESNIEFFVDGESVEPIDTANRATGNNPTGTRTGIVDHAVEADEPSHRRVLVPLRRSRSGNVVLTLKFDVVTGALSPGTLDKSSIPLALPSGANTVKHTLVVHAKSPLTAVVEDPDWVRHDVEPVDDAHVVHWTNSGESSNVNINVSRPTLREDETVIVDLAWLQTWLTADRRHDRATFRLTTSGGSVPLRLPPDTTPDGTDGNERRMKILVDGQSAKIIPLNRSTVTIDLGSPGGQEHEHLVEIWFETAVHRSTMGNLHIELPHIAGRSWTRRTYWQLILPRHECLLMNPSGLTPEFNWAWSHLFATRRADATRRMEQNLKTHFRQPGPATQGTRQYLFSRLSKVGVVEVRTTNQLMMTLVVAGATLVCGALWLQASALRHPLVLLLAAVAILVWGKQYPETAVLLGQAVALGVVVIFVQRMGHWIMIWRKRREGVIHGTTGSSIERFKAGLEQEPFPREDSRVVTTVTAKNPSSVSHSRL